MRKHRDRATDRLDLARRVVVHEQRMRERAVVVEMHHAAREATGAAEIAVRDQRPAGHVGRFEVAAVVDDDQRDTIGEARIVEQLPPQPRDRRHDLRLAVVVRDADAEADVADRWRRRHELEAFQFAVPERVERQEQDPVVNPFHASIGQRTVSAIGRELDLVDHRRHAARCIRCRRAVTRPWKSMSTRGRRAATCPASGGPTDR